MRCSERERRVPRPISIFVSVISRRGVTTGEKCKGVRISPNIALGSNDGERCLFFFLSASSTPLSLMNEYAPEKFFQLLSCFLSLRPVPEPPLGRRFPFGSGNTGVCNQREAASGKKMLCVVPLVFFVLENQHHSSK